MRHGNAQWRDLLTAYDGQTITYDCSGNPLIYYNGTRWNFTWEHGRELATMSGGGSTWTYTYDANGMRTKRTNGSTTYTYAYVGSQLTEMTVGDNRLLLAYDASGSPLAVTYNGTAYYYVTNLQGDVVAILNSSGSTVVTYTYDAWGNILTTTGSTASTLGAHNPLRYRGYVFDQETELYYLQSRYYDPQIGRFINADSEENLGATGTVLGYNLFAYCENNPVNMVDATGMAAINVLFSAIGAIAGWVLGDYVAKALGYSSGWMYWAIRTGVTAGSAVVGWFAGSLMTKLLGNFLRSHLDVVFKMASKLGLSGFRSAMEFLGINPFSLATNSSKFIAIARLFNTTAITIGYDWAVKLYNVAINFGYKVIFHEPHGNYSWHIHLIGANGKLIDLHIQITKTAWDYLQKMWG